VSCPAPHFVVTGCGRSGTKFTAEVLGQLGCATGHEQVFDPPLRGVPDFGDRHGDVSWAAVPLLDRLPAGTVVLHQVRSPLGVIRSVVDFGIASRELGFSWRHDVARRGVVAIEAAARAVGLPAQRRSGSLLEYRRMTAAFRPHVFDAATATGRAARYWVDWNEAVEEGARRGGHRYRRYQLEALSGPLLAELLAEVGHEVDAAACQEALDRVPHDTNRRAVHASITWSDLPAEERTEVQRLAAHYGYAVDAG